MNILLKKKTTIALQAMNKVNHVQKSLLSEVLLSLLIAVGILIQDNRNKEFLYIWYLMFCLRQSNFILITVNSQVPDLAQFQLLSLVNSVNVLCVTHCI